MVQLTPPGSACSIGLGTGLSAHEDPDGNSLTLQVMPWRTGDAF